MHRLKQLFLLLALFVAGSSALKAQQATISPLPQKITWGNTAFSSSVTYRLVGAEAADVDAVEQVQTHLSVSADGTLPITIGEVGDAVAAAYESAVPSKEEGYYLKVSSEGVVIIGRDEAGTFYGVKTFLQIAAQPNVQACEVQDYPSVSPRGVIEGYYGNPWSQTDRIRQFRFYGDNKFNTYIYGPKDDPYHKDRWRENYPAAEAARLKELVVEAKKNKVRFVWAIHPGVSIRWNDADGDGVIDDFKNCLNKLLTVYDLGVREFAVFFDDIGGEGTDPKNQAKLMNYLTDQLKAAHSDIKPLIICPTQYNRGWSSGDYLSILGTQMNPEVNIMWTGNSVVDMINYEDMQWINNQISRKAYIWLNYPVTDYCVDHMLMGPTYGNDLNIASMLSGFSANPMEYAEASKVSLYSIADYTWNMPKYNSYNSWVNAIRYLWPAQEKAFRIFCENNIDLGYTAHGLRRSGESPAFSPLISAYNTKKAWTPETLTKFETALDSVIWASNALLEDQTQPEMLAELTPWIKVLRIVAERGKALTTMEHALRATPLDSISFIREYQRYDSLWVAQKKILSRNFPGSIKTPNPVAANEVLAPFLAKLHGTLENEYRKRSTYRLDLLPELVLPEGRYYIKWNGKYLTNTAGSSNPTWVADKDMINPARQEWNVTIDGATGRYKIVSAQDNRYVNELGNFGTNEYLSDWNTYIISRLKDRFAIRNAQSAGINYWVPRDNRIRGAQGGQANWDYELYQFEFVPLTGDLSSSVFEYDTPFYITYKGKYLTASDSKMQPLVFRDKMTSGAVKKQQWIFSKDATTKRVKLINAYNKWYVNEKGVFGSNDYYSTWNSYVVTEVGSTINIQNAGDGGSNFWTVGNDGVLTTSGMAWEASFKFGLESAVPTSVRKPHTAVAEKNSVYTINGTLVTKDLDNKNLSDTVPGGVYVVGNKKVVVE